ncbi:MAG: hypothetical protein MZV64_12500 [Ignavibacteriales bacterium]|nr:hypothetical protein [Ignavibacteriales bacterium]
MRDAGAPSASGATTRPRAIYATGAFAAGGRPDRGAADRPPRDRPVRRARERRPRPARRAPSTPSPSNAAPAGLRPAGHPPPRAPADGRPFFTLYGHLDRGLARRPRARPGASRPGQRDRAGRRARPRTADWPPHAPLPDHPRPARSGRGLPRRRRCRASASLWTGLSPDPNLLLRHPRRPLPRRPNRPRRRRWPRAGRSSAATSASPTASP